MTIITLTIRAPDWAWVVVSALICISAGLNLWLSIETHRLRKLQEK